MMKKQTPGESKENQAFTVKFGAYCALTSAKADLSLEAGRMLSLSETIEELVRRHAGRKGVAA